MQLYKISNQMKLLEERYENSDIPEADRERAIAHYYEGDKALEEKIEDMGYLLKNKESFLAAIEAEEKKLAHKKQMIKNFIERFKAYLLEHMEKHNKLKVDCGTFKVSIATSPGATEIQDADKIPAKYRDVIPETTVIRKKDVLADLRKGEKVPGAILIKRKTLRIK